MRAMSTALLNFLNSTTQMVTVDLYTFELKNGVTLRFCNASSPVTFGGVTWQQAPAGLTRSKIRWTTGVEVDTLDIDFQADGSIVVNGTALLAAAVLGLFDNARVTLSRLFMRDWSTPIDTLQLFQGSAGSSEVLRQAVHMTVKSDLDKLNVMIPPSVYQPSCVHALYDMGCAVNPATYRVSGSVSSVGADGGIATGLTQAADWFQMGAIKFTGGQNAGLTRTVKSYLAGGTVYVTKPFPFPVVPGDAFVITPGCDKLRTGDCTKKYNNTPHFKGFEFIPVPETAA